MGKPVANATEMISSLDLMPTVLDLLKVDKPAGMDGRSLVPLLRGEKQEGRDHVFTHVNTVSSGRAFPGRCVRTKTRAYIWNAWPDGVTTYRVEAMNGMTFAALSEAGKTDARIQARVRHFLYRTPQGFRSSRTCSEISSKLALTCRSVARREARTKKTVARAAMVNTAKAPVT